MRRAVAPETGNLLAVVNCLGQYCMPWLRCFTQQSGSPQTMLQGAMALADGKASEYPPAEHASTGAPCQAQSAGGCRWLHHGDTHAPPCAQQHPGQPPTAQLRARKFKHLSALLNSVNITRRAPA